MTFYLRIDEKCPASLTRQPSAYDLAVASATRAVSCVYFGPCVQKAGRQILATGRQAGMALPVP